MDTSRDRPLVAVVGSPANETNRKPRFGSWGKDVYSCATTRELRRCIDSVADRPWFRRHGAIVQELVPSPGYDLRLVVASGTIVGAIERHPQAGEWRTNVTLGAEKRPARPSAAASELALAAAAAVGADLVGVDLLPLGDGYVVIELNGAVDFDLAYVDGQDVYALAAAALGLNGRRRRGRPNSNTDQCTTPPSSAPTRSRRPPCSRPPPHRS